jgi:alpha-tubulin suppressor-like RCC1 family protein
MTPNSERDEPTEVETLDNIRIKQIFAQGYSSFAVSEGGNNLYGWGNNNHGQLGVSPSDKKNLMIPVPTLIDVGKVFNNEIHIIQDRKGIRTSVAECKWCFLFFSK